MKVRVIAKSGVFDFNADELSMVSVGAATVNRLRSLVGSEAVVKETDGGFLAKMMIGEAKELFGKLLGK